MKLLSALFLVDVVLRSSAFVVAPPPTQRSTHSTPSIITSSSVQMGLLDFFSDEARQKRDELKRKEREEQERLQKAIMERRKNPELMEEYERKVAIRRELRMAGNDDAAAQVNMYEDVDSKTLLDGTKGISQ
jgi:hypothetical protein